MRGIRLARRRLAPLASVAALVAFAASLAGCSTRDDPHYNRYCPYNGRPGLLEYAEDGLDAADRALDNLQERLENRIE